MRQLLQTISAFVYCNRQAPPAGARLNAPVNSAHNNTNTNTFDRQLHSADGRWAEFSLNYFITEPRVK